MRCGAPSRRRSAWVVWSTTCSPWPNSIESDRWTMSRSTLLPWPSTLETTRGRWHRNARSRSSCDVSASCLVTRPSAPGPRQRRLQRLGPHRPDVAVIDSGRSQRRAIPARHCRSGRGHGHQRSLDASPNDSFGPTPPAHVIAAVAASDCRSFKRLDRAARRPAEREQRTRTWNDRTYPLTARSIVRRLDASNRIRAASATRDDDELPLVQAQNEWRRGSTVSPDWGTSSATCRCRFWRQSANSSSVRTRMST